MIGQAKKLGMMPYPFFTEPEFEFFVTQLKEPYRLSDDHSVLPVFAAPKAYGPSPLRC